MYTRSIPEAALLWLLLATVLVGASASQLRVEGKFFTDEHGRVRIFHGFNAVQKGAPWYPAYMFNETQLKYYEEWGFNAVRLGTMWSGVMPQQGVVNSTYLEVMGELVQLLGRYGLHSLLDMHQDVLSSLFDSYDGAPLWLVSKSQPNHAYPWPLEHCCRTWGLGYLTEACGRGFQDIYDNVHQSRDWMASAWKEIARTFAGSDTVLGYELFNEPWAGDIYEDPLRLLPGVAGSTNLEPLYDVLNDAIRAEDNDTIIFFEPVTWGMIFPSGAAGSGFSHVPGGDDFRDRSALSYHYYCWVDASVNGSEPYPRLERVLCDKLLGPQVFKAVSEDIARIGGGSMLTEFGLCYPDGMDDEDTEECEWVLGEADKYLQSWTYWDGGFFNSDGSINTDRVRSFARAYARATAGVPISMSFDVSSAHFQFKYNASSAIAAPTEIVVPPLHYPNGFEVSVSGGLEWEMCGQVLCVSARGGDVAEAEVDIKPKK